MLIKGVFDMILDERKIYYVYEWYNIDTGEIFYVGKGRDHRCKDKAPADRNKPFIKYINENKNCTYRKIMENLDEDTACKAEDKRIKELKAIGQCCCNIIDRTTHRGVLYGEANGFYGKTHTPEALRKMIEANSDGRNAGENNSQYGISPKDRMSPEVYAGWRIKQQQNKVGELNGRSTTIVAFNEEESKEFSCMTYCAEYIHNKFNLNATIDSTRSRISECLRCGSKYCGYSFEMKDDKYTYVPKKKFCIAISKSVFADITNACKEKSITLSELIVIFMKMYMANKCELEEVSSAEGVQIKTMRVEKTLADKFDEVRGEISRSSIINSMIKMYLEGKIDIESQRLI